MGLLGTAIASIALGALVCELYVWLPKLSHLALQGATRRLPKHLRDRYAEEWAAHQDALPNTIIKLAHAVGCYLAAGRVPKVDEIEEEAQMFSSLLMDRMRFLFKGERLRLTLSETTMDLKFRRAFCGEARRALGPSYDGEISELEFVSQLYAALIREFDEQAAAGSPNELTFLALTMSLLSTDGLQQLGVDDVAEFIHMVQGDRTGAAGRFRRFARKFGNATSGPMLHR